MYSHSPPRRDSSLRRDAIYRIHRNEGRSISHHASSPAMLGSRADRAARGLRPPPEYSLYPLGTSPTRNPSPFSIKSHNDALQPSSPWTGSTSARRVSPVRRPSSRSPVSPIAQDASGRRNSPVSPLRSGASIRRQSSVSPTRSRPPSRVATPRREARPYGGIPAQRTSPVSHVPPAARLSSPFRDQPAIYTGTPPRKPSPVRQPSSSARTHRSEFDREPAPYHGKHHDSSKARPSSPFSGQPASRQGTPKRQDSPVPKPFDRERRPYNAKPIFQDWRVRRGATVRQPSPVRPYSPVRPSSPVRVASLVPREARPYGIVLSSKPHASESQGTSSFRSHRTQPSPPRGTQQQSRSSVRPGASSSSRPPSPVRRPSASDRRATSEPGQGYGYGEHAPQSFTSRMNREQEPQQQQSYAQAQAENQYQRPAQTSYDQQRQSYASASQQPRSHAPTSQRPQTSNTHRHDNLFHGYDLGDNGQAPFPDGDLGPAGGARPLRRRGAVGQGLSTQYRSQGQSRYDGHHNGQYGAHRQGGDPEGFSVGPSRTYRQASDPEGLGLARPSRGYRQGGPSEGVAGPSNWNQQGGNPEGFDDPEGFDLEDDYYH